MKVILNADIKGVGKKGDVLNASDGYARNYLLPRKLAVKASEENLAELRQKSEAKRFKKREEVNEALELSKEINGKTITFKVKAGENGRLFGSITSKDIAGEIKKQLGFEIDKKKLVMDEAIKCAGVYNIEVKVYPEVSSKLKVEVIAE